MLYGDLGDQAHVLLIVRLLPSLLRHRSHLPHDRPSLYHNRQLNRPAILLTYLVALHIMIKPLNKRILTYFEVRSLIIIICLK